MPEKMSEDMPGKNIESKHMQAYSVCQIKWQKECRNMPGAMSDMSRWGSAPVAEEKVREILQEESNCQPVRCPATRRNI